MKLLLFDRSRFIHSQIDLYSDKRISPEDSSFLGARVGALAVLHTWTRAMLLNPHS